MKQGLKVLFSILASQYAVTSLIWVARGADVSPQLSAVGLQNSVGREFTTDDLVFVDELGNSTSFYLASGSTRPVMLSLVYYQCPSLCSLTMQGVVKALKELKWKSGKKFELVFVSIDPREGPVLASKKKENFVKALGAVASEGGIHFLTGTQLQIKRLAERVGFGFKRDEKTGQYAHAAAIYVLTPPQKATATTRVSRIFSGIEYPAAQLRLALLEASNGSIGTFADQVLLYCYRYDPASGGYALQATRVMQIVSGLFLAAMGLYFAAFWLRKSGPGFRGRRV